MTATTTVPVIGRAVVRRIVAFACRAPSIYNTQPWAWRLQPGGVDLFADRSRALPAADGEGRSLVISCGAALHHAQVAARALGWETSVHRLPDAEDPDLLAEIRFSRSSPPPGAAGELAALRARFTDRRRFTSWPVPVPRLERLAQTADEWGGRAVGIGDVTDKFRLELLLGRALRAQSGNAAVAAEMREWLDRPDDAGVPAATVPARPGPDESHTSRFGIGSLDDPARELEGTDGLIVLGSEEDAPSSWLRCGESLSAMWLRAVQEGLSVVPLTQVVEVPETRSALFHDVLHGAFQPLLVVRVGWQEISREHIPETPRRALDDVLRP